MTDLERLIAVHEIMNLVARRARALDARDWETYTDCHAPEHTSTGTLQAEGREAMMEALKKETAGVSATHHVHSPNIEILSPTQAKGSWALEDRRYWKQGDEDHWLHGWGYYDETYVKQDGRWLVASRDLTRSRVEHSPGSIRDPKNQKA